MRFVALIFLLSFSVFASNSNDKLFECTEIFKQRKSELLVELERIDEQKQSLQALKTATEELLKEKEKKISIAEKELELKLQTVTKKEKSIQKMLTENKKILAAIQSTKMDKIAQTYAKMKAGAAAGILEDMQAVEAAKILQSLKPKVVGKILSKMDPQKASQLTILLAK
jgi:flagellar motility protein MotE (MotC chaperone)